MDAMILPQGPNGEAPGELYYRLTFNTPIKMSFKNLELLYLAQAIERWLDRDCDEVEHYSNSQCERCTENYHGH